MKPWIEEIRPYVPGMAKAADGRELVKLSANENPLGTSKQAIAAIHEASEMPAGYPNPAAVDLRAALGELHGVDPQLIVCGTGSDELLNAAATAFAGPGDEILFSAKSFSYYGIAARRSGAAPVEVPDKDYGIDVDALLSAVNERTRLIYLANPNNPTGTFLPRAEVARLHAGLPNQVLLVDDQAYAEYLEPNEDDGGFELAKRSENVLVTRTFSKIYGLAGLRVGWATGSPHLIDALNRVRAPFNVTNPGLAGALEAVRDQEFVERSRQNNAQSRAEFTAAMQALGNYGIRPIPSFGNFLLVLFEGSLRAEAAQSAIEDAGYAVRRFAGEELGHALRITIGTPQQMSEIAEVIRGQAARA